MALDKAAGVDFAWVSFAVCCRSDTDIFAEQLLTGVLEPSSSPSSKIVLLMS